MHYRSAITRLQAIILAVVIIVAAVGATTYYYMTITPQYTAKTIKIGVIANLGWPVGLSASQAVRLAVDKINEAGGILGWNVTLIVEDSKGEVPTAVAAYKKLVMTDGVTAVVVAEGGTLTLACIEAGAELFREYPHIMFNAGASAYDIAAKVRTQYEKYKFVINPYTTAPDRFASAAMVNTYLTTIIGARKVAIIGEDLLDYNPYWNGWPEHGFRPYPDVVYRDRGIEVVYTAKIAVGEKMFLPIFEQIAASGAEYIDFAMSAYSDFYTLAKQWAESPAKNIPIFHSGVSPKYWETTGGACLGIIGWWPSDFDGQVNKYEIEGLTTEYLLAFKQKYGYAGSNWLAEGAYDDVLFFKGAVETAGTLDIETLIRTMETIEVKGVRGLIKINRIDHTSHNYPYVPGYVEDLVNATAHGLPPTVVYEKYGYEPYGWSLNPIAPLAQWQKNGKLVILYPPWVAEKSNPGQGYVSPANLRAG